MHEIYERIEEHLPYLRRYARSLAGNPADADDLVQECAARAMAKRHLYRPGTNLRAWLSTILRNLHVNEIRLRSRWGAPVDLDVAAPRLTTPPGQAAGLVLNELASALVDVPEDQRIVLGLVAVEGMSYAEAADRLDLPIGTVKSRVSRARETLRHELAVEDGLDLAA